jgi:hypothetical protein
MSASRADRRLARAAAGAVTALLGLALLCLAGLPARADDQDDDQAVGPPIRLGPPPEPASDTGGPPTIGSSTGGSRAPKGITVDRLAPPESDAAGILKPADHPLPPAMWQGTGRAFAIALIPRIGVTTSPALHDLAYRLLAGAATPPQGDAPAGALLALRAERLANGLGRAGAALELLETAPPNQGGEALGQTLVDLAFLAGDTGRACAVIKGRDHSWQETYWDQGMVTCEALQGQEPQARLGLDLLREDKFKDNGFSALVELALGGTPHMLEALPAPQPMSLLLLAKAQLPLPRHALDGAGPAILHAMALGAGIPADQRAAAAEKAAAFGALSPQHLAEAWQAVPLDAGDKDNPLNRALAAGGMRGRAILWQAMKASEAAPSRANFIATLLDKTPRQDLYFPLVRALEPMLLELPPDPGLADDAADIARALLALDRPAEAARWLALAQPDAAKSLVPLAHLVDDKSAPAWGDEDLAALFRHGTKDPALAQRRAVLAAQLLAAEGTPAPEPLLLPLLEAQVNVPPNAAPVTLMDSEAANGRLAGTVLTGLVALGDQGALSPGVVVARVAAALRSVGLPDDAHRLAIDAAIAAGF